jgi:hypothetical protein
MYNQTDCLYRNCRVLLPRDVKDQLFSKNSFEKMVIQVEITIY